MKIWRRCIKILINEIFPGLQGEGKYSGQPVLIIRTSGCTRKCKFCDSAYHTKGKKMEVGEVIKAIVESGMDIVVWTGGEPTMQLNKIFEVKSNLPGISFHLETNGDILPPISNIQKTMGLFDYICFSPKDLRTARRVEEYLNEEITFQQYDIKIVTDLKKTGKDLLSFATMLMPLTTSNSDTNRKIKQAVWNYCLKKRVKFCLRQHVEVWGVTKRGV